MFSYHKIYSLFYLCIKRGHSFMQSFISQACIALLQSGYSVPILGVQECAVHCPCPHESYTLAMELNKESGKQKVILCVCVTLEEQGTGGTKFCQSKAHRVSYLWFVDFLSCCPRWDKKDEQVVGRQRLFGRMFQAEEQLYGNVQRKKRNISCTVQYEFSVKYFNILRMIVQEVVFWLLSTNFFF